MVVQMINTIDLFSGAGAIISFVVYISYRLYKSREPKIETAFFVAIAGAMIPVAIAFVIYPFFPLAISSISSYLITIMGLVLLFVYSKVIFTNLRSDSS